MFRIEDMDFHEAKKIYLDSRRCGHNSDYIRTLVEDNKILTEEEKILILYCWSNLVYAGSIRNGNKGLKFIKNHFRSSKGARLRQSLYNVMFIKENSKKGLATIDKVADYKNLIRRGLAYTRYEKITVKDLDYSIDKVVLIEVLVLTPLANFIYEDIKYLGKSIIKREVKRLERMGAI